MKARFVFSAFCMLVAMTMATGAFAQARLFFETLPLSEARGRIHSYGDLAGDILFARQQTSTLTADSMDTITISYGAPIGNSLVADRMSDPDGFTVEICDKTMSEVFAENSRIMDLTTDDIADNEEDDSLVEMNSSRTRLTIRLMTELVSVGCNNAATSLIEVKGVRLRLVGSGQDSITTRVSSAGDIRLVGDREFTSISSIVDELDDDGVKVKPMVRLSRSTGKHLTGSNLGSEFKLMLTEKAADSFKDASIDLEFIGIPTGDDINVTIDAWVVTEEVLDRDGADAEKKQVYVDETLAKVSLETHANEATVTFPDATLSDSSVDVVIIVGSISGLEEDEQLPLGDISIQAVANVGPGSRSDTFPRFSADPTTAVTVIESSPDRSMMTFTLAISNGAFDTGIAVVNMSKNLTGPIKFTFYNMDGTMTEYTTSASSAGSGLTNGMLGPKGTYLVLLSELMESNFTGHIDVTADFTGATGSGYISDFSGFSSSVTVAHKN